MESRAKLKLWKTTMPMSKVFENFIRKTVATAADGNFRVLQKVVDKDEVQHLYRVSWNPRVKVHRLGKTRLCFTRVCLL